MSTPWSLKPAPAPSFFLRVNNTLQLRYIWETPGLFEGNEREVKLPDYYDEDYPCYIPMRDNYYFYAAPVYDLPAEVVCINFSDIFTLTIDSCTDELECQLPSFLEPCTEFEIQVDNQQQLSDISKSFIANTFPVYIHIYKNSVTLYQYPLESKEYRVNFGDVFSYPGFCSSVSSSEVFDFLGMKS